MASNVPPDSLNQCDLTNQQSLSFSISFCLSSLLPSAIFLPMLLFGKIILPLHSLLEVKSGVKGCAEGERERGQLIFLLFKSEACSLLGDNWHTRRVMCLDWKGKSKKEEKREDTVDQAD